MYNNNESNFDCESSGNNGQQEADQEQDERDVEEDEEETETMGQNSGSGVAENGAYFLEEDEAVNDSRHKNTHEPVDYNYRILKQQLHIKAPALSGAHVREGQVKICGKINRFLNLLCLQS
jgi:hypothetical protein